MELRIYSKGEGCPLPLLTNDKYLSYEMIIMVINLCRRAIYTIILPIIPLAIRCLGKHRVAYEYKRNKTLFLVYSISLLIFSIDRLIFDNIFVLIRLNVNYHLENKALILSNKIFGLIDLIPAIIIICFKPDTDSINCFSTIGDMGIKISYF